MDDPSHSLTVLHELRELGVRFSIDDFGTGYSSLSYLRELPIDEVKIDRTFVADLVDDDTIVRSVIDLGHNLGLHVVAEGVEDVPTMDRLQELGCDSAQGFHFGAPMDADDLTTYLDGAWENVIMLR
jgi:EAL domain-containing protein (putative c-di-GMP-specific phosphodiesterase class I)